MAEFQLDIRGLRSTLITTCGVTATVIRKLKLPWLWYGISRTSIMLCPVVVVWSDVMTLIWSIHLALQANNQAITSMQVYSAVLESKTEIVTGLIMEINDGRKITIGSISNDGTSKMQSIVQNVRGHECFSNFHHMYNIECYHCSTLACQITMWPTLTWNLDGPWISSVSGGPLTAGAISPSRCSWQVEMGALRFRGVTMWNRWDEYPLNHQIPNNAYNLSI